MNAREIKDLSVNDMKEEFKSLDNKTLQRMIRIAQEELKRRHKELDENHRGIVIENSMVKRFL